MAIENTRTSATATAARTEGYGAVFTALRKLLKPYEADLAVRVDRPGNCYLETRSASFSGRHLLFAGAKIKKNYVSFYLPALYMFPDLSDKISAPLKKIMQGQACFNFTVANQEWFEELSGLTQAGFQKFKSESLL